MKALLVDAENDPSWDAIKPHRFGSLFFPVSDPPGAVRARSLEAFKRGYAPGLFMAWNWPQFGGLTARGVAELMHQFVAERTEKTVPRAPKVQFDIEAHEPEFILEVLQRWRALRPQQDTSWTLEGFQGGWMTPAFVEGVIAAKVRVVPQAYVGRMARIELRDSDPAAFLDELLASVADPRAVALDLTERGFPDSLVSPYYDAAFLPLYWSGYAFTQGRLP